MLTVDLPPGRRLQRPGPTLDQASFDAFGALLGTDAPIHVDPAYAAKTVFGSTIAQGMLLLAPVETWLCELFGEEAWSVGGRLQARLISPARVNEAVWHELEVTSNDTRAVTFAIRVMCDERLLASGTATIVRECAGSAAG